MSLVQALLDKKPGVIKSKRDYNRKNRKKEIMDNIDENGGILWNETKRKIFKWSRF